MNDGAINLWITPDGQELLIPDDIFKATTFRKDGWPDKRVKANAAFWAWLKQREEVAVVIPESPAKRDEVWVASVAQAYARRVWNGQSVNVPNKERLRRVAFALEAQGLSMEGVELP